MFWATGLPPGEAAKVSGSSLLTLGFATVETPIQTVLAFVEAGLGLVMVAVLISYLPTIYSAFARREAAVTLLEVRAGTPPSPVEMFLRYNRIHNLDELGKIWTNWEGWFADIEESHTSLAALTFFRSPQPNRSWVTAAGTILDAAALANPCSTCLTIRRPISASAPAISPCGASAIFSASSTMKRRSPATRSALHAPNLKPCVTSWPPVGFRSKPTANRPGAPMPAGGSTTTLC